MLKTSIIPFFIFPPITQPPHQPHPLITQPPHQSHPLTQPPHQPHPLITQPPHQPHPLISQPPHQPHPLISQSVRFLIRPLSHQAISQFFSFPVHSVNSLINHSSGYSYINSIVHFSCSHSFIRAFTVSSILLFIHPFIHSNVHSFIQKFIHSFIQTFFNYSSIHQPPTYQFSSGYSFFLCQCSIHLSI